MTETTAPRRLIPSGRTPAAIIRAHIPSITRAIEESHGEGPWDIDGEYNGADRECACGLLVEGFYAYADHLADVLTAELQGGRS